MVTCEEWAAEQAALDQKSRMIDLLVHLFKSQGSVRRGKARRAARKWYKENPDLMCRVERHDYSV